MKRRIVRLAATALLALISLTAGATAASTDSLIAQVESNLLPNHIIKGQTPYRLQERMEHYGVPGISIALIDDLEVRWIAQYGVASVGSREPVRARTLFNVGSMSKAVASAAILALVELDRVDLDGDIDPQLCSWHIPPNDFTAESPITPRQLMNHSAGLPHRPPFNYTADALPTTMQMINGQPPSRSKPLQVVQRPGTRFQYSNGGFTVLQILTEDVTGLTYDEAVRELVFDPLGLDDATFQTPLSATRMATAATGHDRDGSILADPPRWMAHTAAGGLWITAQDYARFVVEIQKSVLGESNRLFSRELAEAMTSPHAAEQYGLGVFLYEGDGSEPYFSHIGDGPGFVGGYTSHRTSGDAVVVLTNGKGGINLCREILRSAARVYDWPGYLPPVQTEIPLDDDELAAIAGRYRIGLDTVVALAHDDGRLRIDGEGLPGFTLFQVADGTFVCRERKGNLSVRRLDDGSIAGLDLDLSDDIGRMGGHPSHAQRMDAGESTPLEMLRCGRYDDAVAAYQAHHASHADARDVSESRFNRLGYRLMGSGDLEGALAVFELNTQLYPESGNVFDSYGEALLKAGREAEGIAAYRRSLELDPGNANAERVLHLLSRT